MKNICFCVLMQIPMRLRRYRFYEIGQDHYYYDDIATEEYVSWKVKTSFLPLARTLQEMVRLSKGKFHCSLAIPGTTLELLEQYTPELIDVIKELVSTKCVEIVAMPYAYSISAAYCESEWMQQLKLHQDKIYDLFGEKTTTLMNTELLYNDEIATSASKMGFKTLMTEGAKHILSWNSSNMLYHSCVKEKQFVLVRNMQWSDALSFHFSDPSWPGYPMDAERAIAMVHELTEQEELVNIWMGAEAFGILQPEQTGIFEFLKAIPYYALEKGISFVCPREATKKLTSVHTISSPFPLTWTGENKGLSTLDGNDLQQEAIHKLYAVAERVHLCKDSSLKADWLLLQDANYLHYMNHIEHGDSNFESAYDAFINYMNILSDFLQQVEDQYPTTIENEELNSLLQTITNQEEEIANLKSEIKKLKKKK